MKLPFNQQQQQHMEKPYKPLEPVGLDWKEALRKMLFWVPLLFAIYQVLRQFMNPE